MFLEVLNKFMFTLMTLMPQMYALYKLLLILLTSVNLFHLYLKKGKNIWNKIIRNFKSHKNLTAKNNEVGFEFALFFFLFFFFTFVVMKIKD